jgi:hypothetical protein
MGRDRGIDNKLDAREPGMFDDLDWLSPVKYKETRP